MIAETVPAEKRAQSFLQVEIVYPLRERFFLCKAVRPPRERFILFEATAPGDRLAPPPYKRAEERPSMLPPGMNWRYVFP